MLASRADRTHEVADEGIGRSPGGPPFPALRKAGALARVPLRTDYGPPLPGDALAYL